MNKIRLYWLITTLTIMGFLMVACQKSQATLSVTETVDKSNNLPNPEQESPIAPYPAVPTSIEGIYLTGYPPPDSFSETVPFPVTDTVTVIPDKQLYIDQEGWFSVKFPSDWQISEQGDKKPIRFLGKSGFFETGKLPEMGYMPETMNVCVWLANINTDADLNSVIFGHSCMVKTITDSGVVIQKVYQNQSTGLQSRYFYIKADQENFDEIDQSFQWLVPVGGVQPSPPNQVPTMVVDEEFWSDLDNEIQEFTINEYPLDPDKEEKYSPSKSVLFIPPGALRIDLNPGEKRVAPSLDEINKTIEPINLKFETGSKEYLLNLYQDKEIVIENIYKKSDIYTIPTSPGNKIAFIVYAIKDANFSPYQVKDNAIGYLIEDDNISIWREGPEEGLETWRTPLWINEKLLWVRAARNVHVEVITSDRDRIFSFAAYFATQPPVRQFREWEGYWFLEIEDYLIQDGVILNEQYKFEQAFNWRLIKNKPFYFFQKGSGMGVSYGQNFYKLNYDEIAHNFCCGLTPNNPINNENMLRFYGRRGEDWYYVILDFGEG